VARHSAADIVVVVGFDYSCSVVVAAAAGAADRIAGLVLSGP